MDKNIIHKSLYERIKKTEYVSDTVIGENSNSLEIVFSYYKDIYFTVRIRKNIGVDIATIKAELKFNLPHDTDRNVFVNSICKDQSYNIIIDSQTDTLNINKVVSFTDSAEKSGDIDIFEQLSFMLSLIKDNIESFVHTESANKTDNDDLTISSTDNLTSGTTTKVMENDGIKDDVPSRCDFDNNAAQEAPISNDTLAQTSLINTPDKSEGNEYDGDAIIKNLDEKLMKIYDDISNAEPEDSASGVSLPDYSVIDDLFTDLDDTQINGLFGDFDRMFSSRKKHIEEREAELKRNEELLREREDAVLSKEKDAAAIQGEIEERLAGKYEETKAALEEEYLKKSLELAETIKKKERQLAEEYEKKVADLTAENEKTVNDLRRSMATDKEYQDQELLRKKEEISKYEEELSLREDAVAERERKLSERESVTVEKEKRVYAALKNIELQKRRLVLERESFGMSDLGTSEGGKRYEEYKKTIESKDAVITELNGVIDEYKETLIKFNELIKDKSSIISRLHAKNTEMEQNIQQLKKAISNHAITSGSSQNEEDKKKIAELEKLKADYEQAYVTVQTQLANYVEAYNNMKSTLEQKDTEIAELKKKADSKTHLVDYKYKADSIMQGMMQIGLNLEIVPGNGTFILRGSLYECMICIDIANDFIYCERAVKKASKYQKQIEAWNQESIKTAYMLQTESNKIICKYAYDNIYQAVMDIVNKLKALE